MTDVTCFKTKQSCASWDQEQKAKELCPKQRSCSACLSTDPDCAWSKTSRGYHKCSFVGYDPDIDDEQYVTYGDDFEKKCERAEPDTCFKCTYLGRSWQSGKCNPTNKCEWGDAACYETTASCSTLEQSQQAKEVCPKQQSCSGCVSANSDCGWLKEEKQCAVVRVSWWGTDADKYIRKWDKDKCGGVSPKNPQTGRT